MEITAQTTETIRVPRRPRSKRPVLQGKQAQVVALETNPAVKNRPWLADIDSAATANERAMLFWLDTAARFHTDPVQDVIVALRTVEQPAPRPGEGPLLYVWEVAWHRDPDGIKWLFIVWDVSGYGVRFHPCASRAEAMTLFEQSVVGGLAATASGVFLRPDFRPK